MFAVTTHLTIEQRRIIVHIRDFHSEGTDSLQTGIALIRSLHGDRHKLAVVALAIEDLVGGHLAGFLVNGEFGALLVGLLHNRVLHLWARTCKNCLVIDTNCD